jgi:hypothetical protein
VQSSEAEVESPQEVDERNAKETSMLKGNLVPILSFSISDKMDLISIEKICMFHRTKKITLTYI